jgi:hypothetical protein
LVCSTPQMRAVNTGEHPRYLRPRIRHSGYVDLNTEQQLKRELLGMIEHRMASAHHLYARLRQLTESLSNPAPVEGVHNQVANGALILRLLLERHLDDCERDWSTLEEQVCYVAERHRRPVG